MKKFLITLPTRRTGPIFTLNSRGQKVDEDGFCTSKMTKLNLNRLECVSVKIRPDNVQVRDIKDSAKTTLTFNHAEWQAFIKGVKEGEFDV